jgi:outer membrane biogenesis lipoprotein LolB
MKAAIAVALLLLLPACATSGGRGEPFTRTWASDARHAEEVRARRDYVKHGRFRLLDELEERAGLILDEDGKPKLKVGNEHTSAKVKLSTKQAGVGVNMGWKNRDRSYTPEQADEVHYYVPKPPRVPLVAEAEELKAD